MITFLNLHDYGRFGNRLFMIASTIGIALRNGLQFGFPEWEEQKYFINKLPPVSRRFLEIPRYKWFRHEVHFPIDFEAKKIHDGAIIFGFMQTEKYFAEYESTIRSYFRMKPMQKTFKIEKDSVCIHFRGTDYEASRFPLCQFDYYEKALSALPKKLKIYAFSDDIEVFREMMKKSEYINRIEFVPTGHYIHDFQLMMQCRHFVISNSTYAWWAAWLSDTVGKTVIAPAVWYSDSFTHDKRDVYAKGWKVI